MLHHGAIPILGIHRERRVLELLLVLWLLSIADLAFTLWAHHFTHFYELNPIARKLLAQEMFFALVLFKLSLTALGTIIFWSLRQHAQAELAAWALVGVYVLLTMRWSAYTLEAASL